jgi:sugar phosphate isomerase/epimerase
MNSRGARAVAVGAGDISMEKVEIAAVLDTGAARSKIATHGLACEASTDLAAVLDRARPVASHRTPGLGDTNWTDLVTILRQAGFGGSLDIERWHDPVYRRGTFVPSPAWLPGRQA